MAKPTTKVNNTGGGSVGGPGGSLPTTGRGGQLPSTGSFNIEKGPKGEHFSPGKPPKMGNPSAKEVISKSNARDHSQMQAEARAKGHMDKNDRYTGKKGGAGGAAAVGGGAALGKKPVDGTTAGGKKPGTNSKSNAHSRVNAKNVGKGVSEGARDGGHGAANAGKGAAAGARGVSGIKMPNGISNAGANVSFDFGNLSAGKKRK